MNTLNPCPWCKSAEHVRLVTIHTGQMQRDEIRCAHCRVTMAGAVSDDAGDNADARSIMRANLVRRWNDA